MFPWADLPVILLAMDARMVIYTGSDEEEFPADEYFKEQPAKRFLDGNILTSVKIPQLKAHHGFGSIKVVRAEAAFAQVTIAALLELDGSTIKTARVAAGGAIPFPGGCRPWKPRWAASRRTRKPSRKRRPKRTPM